MLSDDACLTLSDDSASHALGYYRGVLRNSSLEPKAPALCPGLSLFSVNRRAPNRQQAPALVKWSWRPFWGCRRYDESWMTSPGRSRARDGSGRLDALGSSRPGNIEQSPQYGPHLLTVRKHGAAIMRASGDAATRNASEAGETGVRSSHTHCKIA